MKVQESHLDERPVPAKDEVVCRERGFKHARTVRAPGCMGHTHGGRSCNDIVDEMAISACCPARLRHARVCHNSTEDMTGKVPAESFSFSFLAQKVAAST